MALSALLHGAVLGILFLAPPGSPALALDVAIARPRLVTLLPAPTPPTLALAARAPRAPAPAGAGVSGAPGVRARGVAHGGRSRPARSSLDVLTALAGALRAGTGSQPAFVADEALAATDGATLASSAGAGLDMRGTGRGTGGAGDTIGAAPWLSFGGGTGTGTTCSYEELTTRTASMGRIAAIESCSVGRLGHGLATGTGSAHGPRAAPDALDGSPRHGSWNCRCSDDGARGSLARDVVRRVVARHRNEIRACYEHALVARPDLEGRVTARWIVAPDGRVQGASLDAARSDVRSSEIETCVTAAVARWTFPTSAAPTPVSYPFVLGHDA